MAHDRTHIGKKVEVSLHKRIANDMATDFFKFVEQHQLQEYLQPLKAIHILTLCIFHARLQWQPGPPIDFTDRDEWYIPKPRYTPANEVESSSPPFFVTQMQSNATEPRPPWLQAPRICTLCGKGFMNWKAKFRHCEAEHHSWVEYRKRVLWEADKLYALPVRHEDKRRLLANYAFCPETFAAGGCSLQ